MFHKPTEGHCALLALLSVFKQAGDYKDDDDDDGNDDSGLRRSSCGVERDADNRACLLKKRYTEDVQKWQLPDGGPT